MTEAMFWLVFFVTFMVIVLAPAALVEHRKRRRRAMRRLPVEWRPVKRARWYATVERSTGNWK